MFAEVGWQTGRDVLVVKNPTIEIPTMKIEPLISALRIAVLANPNFPPNKTVIDTLLFWLG